jgi:histidine phosphotransferase ChpT
MSGTHGALRLIELTAAHLCRGISDPVGSLDHAFTAPGNGAPRDPNAEKIAFGAARALTTRLELRRAAWGPDAGPMPLARVQSLAGGLPRQVAVDISALDQSTVFPPAAGRIVLNLLLLAADSLPSGGIVVLAGTPRDLFVRIAGPGAAWPSGISVCVADEMEARSALTEGRSLQMALTTLLAHAAGIRLSVVLPPITQNEPSMLRLGG